MSTVESLRAALATPDLRRLQLAWLASACGAWVFFVALAVYAYDAGGPTAVGAAALVRMIPAGLAAPLAGNLADRHSRRNVLLYALLVRAAVLAAMAFAIGEGAPVWVVLALAAVFTIVATAHKPAQAALLPTLAETPRQLAAANAVWSGIDNAAFLVGALIGGSLIAVAPIETAFAATGAIFAVAAIPTLLIPRDPVPEYRRSKRDESGRMFAELGDGFREVARSPTLRLLVGFLTLSTLIEGAVDVLVVVVAIEALDLGGDGVGWLNACWGLGGLIGGLVSLSLLGRGRLAAGLSVGGLMIGLPLLAIAAGGGAIVTGALLVLLGVGYALVEVAGLSLMQRLVGEDVLGRAFAVVESTYWVSTGLGAITAPALVSLIGLEGALLVVGAALPLFVLLRWVSFARLEAAAPVPERPFRALRALPDFAPLPLCAIENAARCVMEVRIPAGETVIHEGDMGDLFYVVDSGTLDVSCNRGRDRMAPLTDGDYFGEIALLRDIPRTATVVARTTVSLFALDRDAFLSAVMAHPVTGTSVATSAESRFARAHAVRLPRDAGGIHRRPAVPAEAGAETTVT